MNSAGSPARKTRLPDPHALELTSAAAIKIWLEPITSLTAEPRGKTVMVALQVTVRPGRRERPQQAK
jgi:hypothetical protein